MADAELVTPATRNIFDSSLFSITHTTRSLLASYSCLKAPRTAGRRTEEMYSLTRLEGRCPEPDVRSALLSRKALAESLPCAFPQFLVVLAFVGL